MDGAGISALVPTVGLGALPDPMGEATALLEARRRQQIEGAGYDPDKGLYDRYSEMLGTVFGPTINERAVAAREAMRRGDMATANALNQSLALDFGQFLGSIKPIRAYHGSPHDFDKFDMSKIGTGEGAQAYGHGLYFAENEGVARSYRDQLQSATIVWPNKRFESAIESLEPKLRDQFKQWVLSKRPTQSEMRKFLINWADGAEHSYKYFAETGQRGGAGYGADHGRALSEVARNLAAESKMPKAVNSGRMYEVNIHADPERFLDWDKPIDPGSPLRGLIEEYGAIFPRTNEAKDAVIAARRPELTGEGVYRSLQRIAGDKPTATNSLLRDADIPGIKYLDQGSRMSGDGTSNYVVFDDKLIEILRKYGIMAPMAGAGVGSLYMDGEGEGM